MYYYGAYIRELWNTWVIGSVRSHTHIERGGFKEIYPCLCIDSLIYSTEKQARRVTLRTATELLAKYLLCSKWYNQIGRHAAQWPGSRHTAKLIYTFWAAGIIYVWAKPSQIWYFQVPTELLVRKRNEMSIYWISLSTSSHVTFLCCPHKFFKAKETETTWNPCT